MVEGMGIKIKPALLTAAYYNCQKVVIAALTKDITALFCVYKNTYWKKGICTGCKYNNHN